MTQHHHKCAKSLLENALHTFATMCLCAISSVSLHCAESKVLDLQQGESIFVYADTVYYNACKDVKSAYKDSLSDKKVKWKAKKAKSKSYTELAKSVDKELLKNKADYYFLALGIDELWDFKGEKATEARLTDYESAIKNIASQVKAANKQLVLCTPHQISAGQVPAFNERTQAATAIIKDIGQKFDIIVCDFYAGFDKKNKSGDPGKYNKGITTKDGLKLNDNGEQIIVSAIGNALGLSRSGPSKKANIGRKLTKGDIIMVIAPKQITDIRLALHNALKNAYGPELGVTAPRAMDIIWGKDFFDKEPPKLEIIGKSNPNIIILYPGSYILGYGTHLDTLKSGEFRKKVISNVQALEAKTKAEIFICTPLIWAEDNNLISTEGANYQNSQLWADETRAAANELNIGVIDLHQKCLNYIQKNSIGKNIFAGRKNVYQGQTTYNDIDYTPFAKDFLLDAVAESLNFDYQAHKE